MAFEGAQALAAACLPHFHRPVVSPRDNVGAIRRIATGPHRVAMAEDSRNLSVLCVWSRSIQACGTAECSLLAKILWERVGGNITANPLAFVPCGRCTTQQAERIAVPPDGCSHIGLSHRDVTRQNLVKLGPFRLGAREVGACKIDMFKAGPYQLRLCQIGVNQVQRLLRRAATD